MAMDHNANEMLKQVTEGMQVVDSNGEDVGKVTFVHFTDEGAATNNPAQDPGEGSLIDDLAEAFTGGSGQRDEMDERLLRQGFIKIDATGVIDDEKYVTSGQVAGVSGDTVRLTISKDGMYS